MMDQDKRRRTRVEVGSIRVQLVVSELGEEPIELAIRDVSLKGLSCPAVKGVTPGMNCVVTITPGPGVEARIKGVAARCTDDLTAVDFQEMDADSFYHLRRLVQLHAEDPDDIDTELTTPAFD
jgi:hypothetical protein